MDEFTEGTSSEGFSRRTVIKRAGVVSALAWTAPVLSSMGAKALAGTAAPCAQCGTCAGQTDCSPAGGFCTCIVRVDRGGEFGCFCHQPSVCADLLVCADDSDCPAEYACANSCCFDAGFGSRCHPPCLAVAGAAVVKGQGLTSIG